MVINVPELGEVRQKYRLLNIIEFDSDRKRMTVIVETPDKKILVICKGADSILEPRLLNDGKYLVQSKKYSADFGNVGLRVLFIASKVIEKEFYDQWAKKYWKADTMTVGKAAAMNLINEELENDFELIGSTAIEDKL